MTSKTLFIRRWAARAGLLLAAGTLAACTVEPGPGGGGHYRPRPPQQACTMEHAPVCGQRGNDRQTFGNSCMARASGYNIVGPGECRPGNRPERPGRDRPDRACTREYAPVCGERGRTRQTFANACEARSSGYDIVGRGECRASNRPDRPDRDRHDRRDQRR